jgi:hypothetical protein
VPAQEGVIRWVDLQRLRALIFSICIEHQADLSRPAAKVDFFDLTFQDLGSADSGYNVVSAAPAPAL